MQACAIALLTTAAALCLLLAPIGYWYYGWHGVWAALSAGAVCAITGMAAFWIGRRFAGRGRVVVGILGAMGIRMGIPLLVCLILAVRGEAHALAGFMYFLLVFYLATLAVETWHSLPSAASMRPSPARE